MMHRRSLVGCRDWEREQARRQVEEIDTSMGKFVVQPAFGQSPRFSRVILVAELPLQGTYLRKLSPQAASYIFALRNFPVPGKEPLVIQTANRILCAKQDNMTIRALKTVSTGRVSLFEDRSAVIHC